MTAAAHGEVPTGPADLWNHWPLEPTIVAGLLVTAAVYGLGVFRLWTRAGVGRVVPRRRVAAFGAGMLALIVALLSPLDPLGEVLFSAHMVQHLLLILVAAPLLVLGAPEVAALWALPPRGRKALGQLLKPFQRFAEREDGGALLSLASVAIATAVLWLWHAPMLYDLAVRNEAVHAAEHAAFLSTAILFWASVLRLNPRAHLRNGARVLYVFAMAVQGSILGALITFAQRPLYASHASIPEAWGIAPLPDQQLAGLIMWVPPALLYIGVTALLFVRWLEAVEERSRAQERREDARAWSATAAIVALLAAGCAGDAAPGLRTASHEETLTRGDVRPAPDGFLPAIPPDTPAVFAAGALQSPETALWDEEADVYLVSNINGELTAADDNGFIARIAPDGQILDLRWIDGATASVTLHGPKGMIFMGDRLVVADVGAVRFFDRSSGAPLGAVPIPAAYMLNDPALGADGALYVSDTGDAAGQHPGAVYRVEGAAARAVAEGDHLERPDGLIPFEDALLVTPFAPHARQVYRLAPDGGRVPFATLPEPQLDGLLRLPDGSLIVTSWGGNAVYRIRGRDVERIGGGIPTPAQVGFDARRRRVLVPVLRENRLLIYELPPTG